MSEIVTLSFVALLIAEIGVLLPGFHTFGNDAVLEASAHPDYGADDCGVAGIIGDLIDERLVYF